MLKNITVGLITMLTISSALAYNHNTVRSNKAGIATEQTIQLLKDASYDFKDDSQVNHLQGTNLKDVYAIDVKVERLKTMLLFGAFANEITMQIERQGCAKVDPRQFTACLDKAILTAEEIVSIKVVKFKAGAELSDKVN